MTVQHAKTEEYHAETIGVDVSKGTLDDISLADPGHRRFTKDRLGFALFVKWVDGIGQALIVHEFAGANHLEV